uniref:Uncharacterized protein n=1 Tax=Romanomermis culicivorax TaxID=13658 RepID=A0A915KEN0_ROMCU
MLFTVVFILSLFMRITCSKFYEEMAERAFDELTSMTVCAGIGVGSGGARRTSKRRDGDGCRKTSTRVYVDDSYNRSLRAHLPDGPLAAGATTRVNGFLVLDPFPDDEYGHFVAIFAFWMCDTDNNNRENNIQLETGVCLRLLSKCGNRSTDFLPATFVDRHSTTFMENPCFSIEVGEIAVVRPMKRHELKCRNLTSFQVCPPIVKQTAQSLKINVDENPTLVEEKLMGTYKGSSWPNYIASIQRRTSMQNEFFRLRDNLIRRGFDPRWILSFYDNGIFHDVVQMDSIFIKV